MLWELVTDMPEEIILISVICVRLRISGHAFSVWELWTLTFSKGNVRRCSRRAAAFMDFRCDYDFCDRIASTHDWCG